MSSFSEYLKSVAIGHATAINYMTAVKDLTDWFEGQDICPEAASTWDLVSYMSYLNAIGKTKINVTKRLIAIKHFFWYQVEMERRKDNPAEHLKLRGGQSKKIYPVMSANEVEQIYHNYSIPLPIGNENAITMFSRLSRTRNKLMLGLVIWQGLNTWEVGNLKIFDLNIEKGKIRVVANAQGSHRILSLLPFQVAELNDYLTHVRPLLIEHSRNDKASDCTLLFITTPSCGNGHIGGKNIGEVWQYLRKELKRKYPDFTSFYQLRSYAIAGWLKRYNIIRVAYMAGHKYTNATQRYSFNNVEDLQEDINRFHPIR